MNTKLNLSSAYNRSRSRTLSPISPTSTPGNAKTTSKIKMFSDFDEDGQNRSAAVTKLNKTIKHLSDENKSLKEEIVELRDAVKQIFTESRHEKYDERRINMIKFQIIQLERQISILTEALGSRSEAVLEVENTMSMLADKLRSFISAEVKGQMVPIARSDLMALVESSESARIKLFKSIEKNTREELGKDLLYLNPCLNTKSKGQEEPVNLLDINLNRLDYINLRHVSQMESKLSLLYKELVRIHNQVDAVLSQDGSCCRLINGHTANCENERMKTSLLNTSVMIKDCTDDLLALSLLCPSAPWPVLKRPVLKDIPLERVIASLPSLAPPKQEEVNHLLTACVGTLNHRIHLLQKEKSVLEEEIAFHRAVYDSQMKYTNGVFDAVREGCKEFETSARNLLCAPLISILEAYNYLETTKSKDALKEILLILKANESQIKSIVEMFEDPGTENNINRSEALSSFSTEFMQHVSSLISSCQKKRDEAMLAKREVKDCLKASDIELRQCIEELEAKYGRQWVPKHDRIKLHSKTSDAHPDSLPSNLSNSKEFIHSQLFGDLTDSRDTGLNRHSNRKEKDLKKSCSSNQRKNNSFDDNDNTAVLKLRSFLDDDVNGNSKSSSSRKEQWIHDFSSDRTPTPATTTQINSNSQGLSSQSPQKKTKARWKPETEWVNDFTTNDSNPLDEELKGLSPDKNESNGEQSVQDRIMVSSTQQSLVKQNNASKTVLKSRLKPKGRSSSSSRRSYEVDLRVANQNLKLKRPESGSNNFEERKKS